MANLDELFQKPTQYDHPQLRSWLSYKQSPETTHCYVEFRREREGLFFKPARIYFVAERTDGTSFSNSEPWDDDLNTALVDRGFKARDAANESERFGYMLEARLQPIVNQFNDGFFNAVLVHYLNQNGFSSVPSIADKLSKLSVSAPYSGQDALNCEQRIESVLARCADELSRLGYSPEEGKTILASAIAYFLDDRFSITNRALLGWS